MTNEEKYLEHKKQNIINIINKHNSLYSSKYIIDEENFDIEKEFCSENKCDNCGECCRIFPCVFSPGDFLDIKDMDYMLNILRTGLVCIAYSEDRDFDQRVLLIRPRVWNKQDDDALGIGIGDYVPGSHGRMTCKLFDCSKEPCGRCSLPAIYHPSEALLHFMTHNYGGGYYDHETLYNQRIYEEEWKEYQDVMNELYKKYAKEFSVEQLTDAVSKPEEERSKILVKALIGEKI